MVEATVLLKNGESVTMYAINYDDLFERLKQYDAVTSFNAWTLNDNNR